MSLVTFLVLLFALCAVAFAVVTYWHSANLKFVDNWRSAWKWAETRLAVIVGVLTSVVTTNKDFALNIINAMPNGSGRYVIGGLVLLAVSGVPILARIVEKPGGKQD